MLPLRLYSLTTQMQVHQNIVKFLSHDRDILRYSQICRNTRSAVSDSVWRYRFLEKFDAVPDAPVELLREKYQVRHRTTKLYTKFEFNKYRYLPSADIARIEKAQEKVLDMLQNLIIGMTLLVPSSSSVHTNGMVQNPTPTEVMTTTAMR